MSKRAMDSIHSNTMHLVLIDFEGSWDQVSTCRAESWKNLVTNAMLPGNGEAQTWKLLKQLKYCLSFWHVVDPQTNLENKSFSCKIVANLPMSHNRPFNWKTKMLLSITLQVFTFSESGLVTRSGLDCGTLQIDSVAIFCCPPLIFNVVYIHSMANAMACVGRLQVHFVTP